ncbi:hypothetical protein LguiA_020535 [Lonicera macranthoides]
MWKIWQNRNDLVWKQASRPAWHNVTSAATTLAEWHSVRDSPPKAASADNRSLVKWECPAADSEERVNLTSPPVLVVVFRQKDSTND